MCLCYSAEEQGSEPEHDPEWEYQHSYKEEEYWYHIDERYLVYF